MSTHARAILWAQWRSLRNFRPGSAAAARTLILIAGGLWYTVWLAIAALLGAGARAAPLGLLRAGLPWGLLVAFLYWQLAPVLTGTLGASLDLKKLLVYPVPEKDLFSIELLLRLTTGIEMILALTGLAVGLALNPAIPAWAPAGALALYMAFNLFVSTGTRSLLERLLAYKRIREALIVVVVICAGLPQLLAVTGLPPPLRRVLTAAPGALLPWTAAGQFALGDAAVPALTVLSGWILIAYVFGRRQFARTLAFDAVAAQAPNLSRPRRGARIASLYRIPSLLFPDPVAAVLEKELRSLIRSPRFRLVFLMGFSFGLLIWLPVFRRPGAPSGPAGAYPVLVSAYGVILLAEVVIWNVFGFDRSAAELYFTAPVRLGQVLAAKNLAAGFFVLLEVSAITAVCAVVGIALTAEVVFESYAATLILALYLTSAGNLTSVYFPRAVNPDHSWGRSGSSGKMAAILLVIFPVLTVPVLLAYLARYAFESNAAFYVVLAVAAAGGVCVYWVALESAVDAAAARTEALLGALREKAAPLAGE